MDFFVYGMGLVSFLASATVRGSAIFDFSSAKANLRVVINTLAASNRAIVTDFVNFINDSSFGYARVAEPRGASPPLVAFLRSRLGMGHFEKLRAASTRL